MAATPRPFLSFHGLDSWRRAAHRGTALRPVELAEEPPESGSPPASAESCSDPRFESGWPSATWSSPFENPVRDDSASWELVLERLEPPGPEAEPEAAPDPAGLAFDPWCRLYHSVPEKGRVERLLWERQTLTEAGQEFGPATDLLAPSDPVLQGDFSGATGKHRIQAPTALEVDADGRLFVIDSSTGWVFIFELWDRRLLGVLRPRAGKVVDVAARGRKVLALLASPAALLEIDARGARRELVLPVGAQEASRIAASESADVAVLERAGKAGASVWKLGDSDAFAETAFATDLEFDGDGALVVARRPGETFLVWPRHRPALTARGYDGRGIVRTPDGRIGFWTGRGFREAVAARSHYRSRGLVTTFRTDAGRYRAEWGRLFVDACVPHGTEVRAHFASVDEAPPGPVLAQTPPELPDSAPALGDAPTPAMPALSLLPAEDETLPYGLHRRRQRELAWPRQPERVETYETPVHAPPGRFLWVTLELLGNGSRTPKVRSLRLESPAHDLMRRLPKVYSRDPSSEDFLRRFLMPLEGVLAELDTRALARHALVDPASTPAEMLDWLAGFIGLVLDQRCPEAARRRLIGEAVWLFRFRGTPSGLRRFLEICLDRPVLFVEHFRVRGLGGAVVGAGGELRSTAVLGAGFRVGGAIGEETSTVLDEDAPEPEDAFATHAHRFSVVVALGLTEEERAVAEHILEIHRPAHTLYDLCSVDAGMRIGVALYVELTSLVGRTAGFSPLRLGGSLLGRTGIVGTPRAGTFPGASRAGVDSRVG